MNIFELEDWLGLDDEPSKITAEAALDYAEMTVEEAVYEMRCPPCCELCASSGVYVELDGHCEHGFPSAVLELGLI